MSPVDLRCPNGCLEGRFEALNAPLLVDSAGRYLEHDTSAATFVCERCQSVALDMAAAGLEMRRQDEPPVEMLTCPACGLSMLPPEDDPFATLVECPACETRFGVEEGRERLLGGSAAPDDGGWRSS